jgi:hypothetical protein
VRKIEKRNSDSIRRVQVAAAELEGGGRGERESFIRLFHNEGSRVSPAYGR